MGINPLSCRQQWGGRKATNKVCYYDGSTLNISESGHVGIHIAAVVHYRNQQLNI